MSEVTLTPTHPGIDRLVRYFVDAFPRMDITGQRLALELYSLLGKGEAVSLEKLAECSGLLLPEVKNLLEDWPALIYDNKNHITGFWGLSIDETCHHFQLNGKTVYTWCAWDTLFLPELLHTSANITSRCPISGNKIHLTVSEKGIEHARPEQIMVSFLLPDEVQIRKNITACFCQHVFFLHSQEAGKYWLSEYPEAFLLSLDEAFTVGKKMNAVRYNLALDNG